MKSNRKNFLRDNRGQSLVEFALILPIMLVVMFMITEFGRALYQYNALTTAVREGARQGVVSSAASAVQIATDRTNALLTMGNIKPSDVALTVEILDNYNGSGVKVLRVHAEKPFNWAMNGAPTMQGNATVSKKALTLTAESIMHTEAF